jgi:arginyl-tRNA synthetase
MKPKIQTTIQQAWRASFNTELDLSQINVEVPANPEHGEWSTNIALTQAKSVGLPPRQIAETLVNQLRQQQLFTQVTIAGPGFINLVLQPHTYIEALNTLDSKFGQLDLGQGQQVMMEFGQPNTHKAFHVGHLKSAISGLALVGLLENYGYQVIKANFYGDVGMHVAKCTWGAKQLGLPAGVETMNVHERMKWIDRCYVHGANEFKDNPQAEAEIRQINTEIYNHADTENLKLYEQLKQWSLEHLNDAFAQIGVVYDRQYPESEVFAPAAEIVKRHQESIFTFNDGAWIFDGKSVGLTTWVFLTGEGHPTYEAKDLALAELKFQEYPQLTKSLYTTSVEQSERFKVMFYVLGLIYPDLAGKSKHIPFGWLLRDNKKTSSRMGDSIKGMDIIAEAQAQAEKLIAETKNYTDSEKTEIAHTVAMAGLKFLILSHEFHKDINYDPEQFVSFDGFSGPYLLYALSRAQSIWRQAEQNTPQFGKYQISELKVEIEQKLGKLLLRYPEFTQAASENYAPHLLCNYLYDVAQTFNQFYTQCSVLNADTQTQKESRLALTAIVVHVLESGLRTLGIKPLARM